MEDETFKEIIKDAYYDIRGNIFSIIVIQHGSVDYAGRCGVDDQGRSGSRRM